jgi:hypothetical protein
VMTFHVKAAFPQFAGRHVNDLAAVGNIHRLSVLAVEPSKFFRAELLDGASPPLSNTDAINPFTIDGAPSPFPSPPVWGRGRGEGAE